MALIEADQPPDPVKWSKAIQMLHDEDFHRAKVDIMRPISEFENMVNERTLKAVEHAESQTADMRTLVSILGLLVLYLLWAVSRQLRAILGCSAPELQQTIARLGSGDFSSISLSDERRNSVLGWVMETQKNWRNWNCFSSRPSSNLQKTPSLQKQLQASLPAGIVEHRIFLATPHKRPSASPC